MSLLTRMERVAGAFLLLAVLVGTVALYQHAPAGDFLSFDDDYNISYNEHLGSLRAPTIRWAATDITYSRRYMPLGWLTFSALMTLAGLDPWVFHAANLALHVANGILLWGIMRLLIGGKTAGWRQSVACALAVAWWLWHPLRVEVVAWISGLLYTAATTWALLSAWLLLLGLKTSNRLAYVAFTLAYVCSVLTYGIWFGGILIWPLLACHLLRQTDEVGQRAWSRALRITWPVMLAGSVVLALNVAARQTAGATWAQPLDFTVRSAAYIAERTFATLGWMILKMVWPTRLTPADDIWAADVAQGASLTLGLGTLLVIGIVAVWRARRGQTGLAWVAAAFAGLALPFCGALELYFPISDRYTYVGQFVFAIMLGIVLTRATGRTFRVAAVALTGIVAINAVRTWGQLPVWHDSDSLHRHVLAQVRSPANRRYYEERWLGVKLRDGKVAEVEQELIDRRITTVSLLLEEQYQKARALEELCRAEGRVSTLDAMAHDELGKDFGRSGDYRAAKAHLARAVQLAPADWSAQADFSRIYWGAGELDRARAILSILPRAGPAGRYRIDLEALILPPQNQDDPTKRR